MPYNDKVEFDQITFDPQNVGTVFAENPKYKPAAIGIISDGDDRILTFDRVSRVGATIRAVLPEANVFVKDGETPVEALQYRFALQEAGQVIGDVAIAAHQIRQEKPRLFVPVVITVNDPVTSVITPKGLDTHDKLWRRPDEVLEVLRTDDETQIYKGSQRRDIAGFTVRQYLKFFA